MDGMSYSLHDHGYGRTTQNDLVHNKALLELVESLRSRLVLRHPQDVEADGLGQGSALANSDGIADFDTESGGDVGRQVLVALLVTVCAQALRGKPWV